MLKYMHALRIFDCIKQQMIVRGMVNIYLHKVFILNSVGQV